jgi:hypothetical protein
MTRCTFKQGNYNCGSYAFNLYKEDIDQGSYCDRHYWQAKAQRTWIGLTDEDQFNLVHAMNENDWDAVQFLEAADAKLKEKNT